MQGLHEISETVGGIRETRGPIKATRTEKWRTWLSTLENCHWLYCMKPFDLETTAYVRHMRPFALGTLGSFALSLSHVCISDAMNPLCYRCRMNAASSKNLA